MKLLKAEKLANQVVKRLEDHCKRVEIAGSIRRKKPEVKDIEIVCLPDTYKGFRGKKVTSLDYYLTKLEERNKIRFVKNGKRMKNFWLIRKDRTTIIKVDLFIVLPPAEWGVIFTIRTGPTSFNKWLVSYRKPQGFKFKDGAIHRKIEQVDKVKPLWILESTPEEEDVFKVLDIDFITIEEREGY